MRILIATGIYPPEIGGPATYAALLVRELPKRGIGVDLMLFRDVRKYPRIVRHLVYLWQLVAASREVDLIFAQDPVSTGVPAVIAGLIRRKKVVLRIAGDYAWEQAVQRYGVEDDIDTFQGKRYGIKIEAMRRVQNWAVRKASHVISPSRYFANLVSGWNNDKVHVEAIYNGIDLSFAPTVENKFEMPTIITSGRLVHWKGIDTLIGSLKYLPEWELRIAGDGPDRRRLESLAEKCDVYSRVVFLGQLERKDLYNEIAQSHFFALLSKFESFSFQVVEAMHIGVPVIAGNVGNLSEIITDGVNGFLIPINDSEVFADKVKELSMISLGNIAENSRKRAEEFSVDRTIHQLCQTFSGILRK